MRWNSDKMFHLERESLEASRYQENVFFVSFLCKSTWNKILASIWIGKIVVITPITSHIVKPAFLVIQEVYNVTYLACFTFGTLSRLQDRYSSLKKPFWEIMTLSLNSLFSSMDILWKHYTNPIVFCVGLS